MGPRAERAGRSLVPVLFVLLVLWGWEIRVRVARAPRWLLPPPSAIGRTLVDDRALLLHHAGEMLGEVLLGFALALVAGCCWRC